MVKGAQLTCGRVRHSCAGQQDEWGRALRGQPGGGHLQRVWPFGGEHDRLMRPGSGLGAHQQARHRGRRRSRIADRQEVDGEALGERCMGADLDHLCSPEACGALGMHGLEGFKAHGRQLAALGVEDRCVKRSSRKDRGAESSGPVALVDQDHDLGLRAGGQAGIDDTGHGSRVDIGVGATDPRGVAGRQADSALCCGRGQSAQRPSSRSRLGGALAAAGDERDTAEEQCRGRHEHDRADGSGRWPQHLRGHYRAPRKRPGFAGKSVFMEPTRCNCHLTLVACRIECRVLDQVSGNGGPKLLGLIPRGS